MALKDILQHWYYYDVRTQKFNYIEETNPTIDTNPAETNVIWFNKKTGEIFICVDNTPNKNVWKGTNGNIIAPSTLAKVDIFGDGSAIALWTLDGHVKDLGGNYHGKWVSRYKHDSLECYSIGKFGKCACGNDWKGRQIRFTIPVLETLDVVTISAWIKWNGKCCVMPFGFRQYDLYTCCNRFGFNTGNGDIYGIKNFNQYIGQWIHVVAIFMNGRYGRLFINGKEVEYYHFGSINTRTAKITKDFHIFGWGVNSNYRSFGWVDQVRMFNRELTQDEINFLYHET